jgi:hypothetical protein
MVHHFSGWVVVEGPQYFPDWSGFHTHSNGRRESTGAARCREESMVIGEGGRSCLLVSALSVSSRWRQSAVTEDRDLGGKGKS